MQSTNASLVLVMLYVFKKWMLKKFCSGAAVKLVAVKVKLFKLVCLTLVPVRANISWTRVIGLYVGLCRRLLQLLPSKLESGSFFYLD
jgi:hypothetical protein